MIYPIRKWNAGLYSCVSPQSAYANIYFRRVCIWMHQWNTTPLRFYYLSLGNTSTGCVCFNKWPCFNELCMLFVSLTNWLLLNKVHWDRKSSLREKCFSLVSLDLAHLLSWRDQISDIPLQGQSLDFFDFFPAASISRRSLNMIGGTTW